MLNENDFDFAALSKYLLSQSSSLLPDNDTPYHYHLPLHQFLRKVFLFTALAFLGTALVSWGMTLLPHIVSHFVLFIIGFVFLVIGYAVAYVFLEDMFSISYKEVRLFLGALALLHSISWSAFVIPFIPTLILSSFLVLAVMYGAMSGICKWKKYSSMPISLYVTMALIGLTAALLAWWISGWDSFILFFSVFMVLFNAGLLYYIREKLQWMCSKADSYYQGQKVCVMGALLIHSGLELILVYLYNAWCDNESD